jgi:hypothetical protein
MQTDADGRDVAARVVETGEFEEGRLSARS